MLGRTNTGGSGSGGLNFQVIGGTTAPNNPKENTIWVNTDEKITSWAFSAAQPETALEGMVWISTGASSPVAFNALKKNEITVYPLSAKQYVGSALVERKAEIYQSGKWVSVVSAKYIFKQSEGVIIPLVLSSQESVFSVTATADNIYARGYADTGSAVNVCACTESEQDLRGYTTLYVDVEIVATYPNENIYFGVSPTQVKATNHANITFIARKQIGTGNRQTISVDISNVDKGYILANGCGNFYIYNWWYE